MFSFSALSHTLLGIFHIRLFFKLILCHSVCSRRWQFVLPLSAPYSPLQGEHGLILLILHGHLEALGLQMLCTGLTAGLCLPSEQTTAAALLLWYGKRGRPLGQVVCHNLLVCLVFLLFLLWARVEAKEPSYPTCNQRRGISNRKSTFKVFFFSGSGTYLLVHLCVAD